MKVITGLCPELDLALGGGLPRVWRTTHESSMWTSDRRKRSRDFSWRSEMIARALIPRKPPSASPWVGPVGERAQLTVGEFRVEDHSRGGTTTVSMRIPFERDRKRGARL